MSTRAPRPSGDVVVRSGSTVRIGLLVTLLALVVLLVASRLSGASSPVPFGLPDPGPFTRWGLPITGLLSDLAAVAAVAGLALAPLTMHRMGEELTPVAARGVFSAKLALTVWLLLSVVEAWLTVSDQWATPAGEVGLGRVWNEIGFTPQVTALAAQAAIVVAALAVAALATTPRRALTASGFTLLALAPTVLTGHSASSGSHDAAVVSLLLHVSAAVVWCAGLLALWALLSSTDEVRGRAVRRFSALAAWCFGVAALSGVVNALVRLNSFSDLVDSAYGRTVLLKIAALVAVGVIAARLRRLVIDAEVAPARRTFALLSVVELAVIGAAFALGAALARTAPPVGEPYTDRAQSLLGGPLPPEPTLGRVLTSFQFSGVGVAIIVLGTVGYLIGLRTLRRRGDQWPVGRTIAWFLGLLSVGFATVGGLGVYSHVMFSLHMTSHMVISMLAPVLLVLGSPITLAIRALPGPEERGGDGPRQVLVAFLNSRWSRLVTNPAFATIMFTGSLYVIYFSGVFDWLMLNHLGHAMMEIHFLLAGFLFYEVIIGNAPIPKRLPHLGRLGILVLTAPFHAFFAISVMSSTQVIGESYYSMLDRPYSADLLADQNLGGGLTWAMGEIPLLLVAIVLVFQWFRDDTRKAKQRDRHADRTDDAELEAYNAMLERIAENRAIRGDRDPSTRGRGDA